jgi:cell division septation protein DedD
MALPEKKKKFVIRFELGLLGMFTLAAVCFCIFLWMFLLGLWAGQTLLKPVAVDKIGEAGPTASMSLEKEESATLPVSSAPEEPEEQEVPLPAGTESEAVAPSFFVLQVSAYRDPELAAQEVGRLRTAGYDAFAVPPEDGEDPFIRVYIGRFTSLAEATQMAIRLEEQEQIKAYTARLPASRVRLP